MESATHGKLTGFITGHVRTIQTFLFFLAIALIVGTSHLLNADEGIILNGAWKIYNGQSLYTDFFEFVAPGSYYLAYLAMKVMGPSYLAVRAVAILLLALSALALADITRRMGAHERNARIAGTLWILCLGVSLILINHNTWSSEIAVIGLAILLRAIDTNARPLLFGVAGLAIGLVPVFLQTKGAVLVVVLIGVSMILGFMKILNPLRIGALLVGLLVPTVSLFLVWTPSVLWYHLFAWPMARYHEVNAVSPLPLVIALVVFLFLFVHTWKRARTKRVLLAVVGVVQCALYVSVLSQPEFFHTSLVSFSIPLLIALWIESRPRTGGPKALFETTLPLPLICILYLFLAFNVTYSIHTPAQLRDMNAYRERYGEHIYSYPFLANFYPELRAQNPYPFNVLYAGLNTAEEFNQNLTVLKRERPEVIFRGRSLGDKFHYDWTNPHDLWIDQNYEVVQTGWVEILKRRDIE